MARRRSTGRSGKGRRGKGGGARSWAAVGVAGLVGLGYVAQQRLQGGEAAAPARAPVALSTPAAGLAGRLLPAPGGAAAPAAAATAGGAGAATSGAAAPGAVPPELATAFARLGEPHLGPLVDLRRIALEFAGTPEAARARDALARERERAAARVAQLVTSDPEEALLAATRAYVATLDAGVRRQEREALHALSQRALFAYDGRRPSRLVATYTVKSGDSLSRIAAAHGNEFRCLQRFNGLQSDRIRIGQRLVVPKEKADVLIFKGDFELLVLLGGAAVKSFDVATGREGRTPEGRFVIDTKLIEPDWYSPDGKVYPYGSEENILGTRWLGFANTPEHQGFGIHGTKFPESIGTEASMGCIRVRNEDVEQVYDYVCLGAKVRIVR